ncbi:FecCD family ABC transporter permease [Falsigemmobacter intermedius]|uniref:Iron ABC transporter permease n=1 Tax=Falsigemmobacter intermedius TaxID=1553448 RepID=A0A444M8P3_9RHOB|nr:iron ABC transporter permease [Falsigemmobacter intermedius]RWY38827.1 iron ABC transporter permease [Falsigemmobacter intermedius]
MKLLLSLAALCAGLTLVSLFVGSSNVPLLDTAWAYFGAGDPLIVLVMQELRLPRAALALLIGAALGLAGAAMQGFLRNPLADPGIVGTSAFAALGAVIALQTGIVALFPMALPLMALCGAFISVLALLALAGRGARTTTLILSGVALSSAAAALVSLVLNLSPNPFAANEITFWMMGSLADRSFRHVSVALPILLLGAVLIWRARKGLDALSFGEETALSMGVNVRRLRLQLILGSACLSGASTAVAGMIGFVGLVIPHLLRRVTGGMPSRLLLPAALGSAALILAADIAVRMILPGRDLKLGVLTALLGTPVFLHMVWKSRGRDA